MGYALLKAKSSKILKEDMTTGEDESAEGICSLYVSQFHEQRELREELHVSETVN